MGMTQTEIVDFILNCECVECKSLGAIKLSDIKIHCPTCSERLYKIDITKEGLAPGLNKAIEIIREQMARFPHSCIRPDYVIEKLEKERDSHSKIQRTDSSGQVHNKPAAEPGATPEVGEELLPPV